jgi:phage-related minor tail protein
MPEVGSVYIKVRAITDRVGPDIQRAFSSLNSGSIAKSGEAVGQTFSNAIGKSLNGNIFTKVGESLSNFGGEAGSARDKLYQLSKAGYIGGTAITVLLGSVSSLIGGLGGLIGAVGGAIPAVMGLVGAFAALRIGMAVGQLAMSGIMQAVGKATTSYAGYGKSVAAVAKMYRDLKYAQEDAALGQKRAVLELEKARANLIRTQDLPANSMARKEALLAYQEAELNLRKAKDKNKEAGLEAKDPNIFSGTDPFAGLTESQKEFAKYLVSLKPKFDELKEAAAKGFLPILKKNIQGLMKDVFPTFKQGIKDIATGLGGLTTNLSNVIRDPHNVELLGIVMKNIGDNLPIMGSIMGNIYSGMLTVLKASDPLVKRFLNFLNTKTKTFSDWLKAKDASGELQTFFDKAGNIMDKLWKIFEQTLGGFGAIIGANFEPGSGGWIMLDWFDKVTKKFDDLDSTVAGKQSLKQYFIDTAKNSTAVLGAIGALGTEFLKLGANPSIGKTFDNMAKGAPAMGDLATKLADAGPSLGQLVADITIFLDKITDTKAITNFFDTIDVAIKGITAFISNPVVSPLLTVLGQIHGFMFGFMALSKVAGFGFKYMGDTYKAFSSTVGAVPGMLANTKTGISDAGKAIGMIRWPEKGKLGDAFAIGKSGGSLKGGLDAMHTELSSQMSRMVGTTKTAFGNMGQSTNIFTSAIGKAGLFLMSNPIIAAIGLLVGAMVLLYNNSKEFRDFVDTAFKEIGQIFSDTWKSIQDALKPAMDAFSELFKTLGFDTAGAKGSPLVVFFEAIINVVKGVIAVIAPLVTWLVSRLAGAITAVVTIFSGFIKIIKGITDLIGAFFKALMTGKWDEFGKAADKAFKGMKAGAMQIFAGIVNFFIDGINSAIRLANDVSKNISTISKGLINLGTIKPLDRWVPKMAKGGTVLPSAGGSLVNVAEAGRPERIEPLDANGLSNRDKAMIDFLTKNRIGDGQPIQIIVNPSAGMNERDLAEMVSRKLAFELRRGAY